MKGRTRKQQIGIITAMIVGVFAISIGFAAFSSTLNIKSSATVNPDASSFSVIFSNDGDNVDATQTVNPSSETYGEDATITNGANPSIGGLKAKFTSPGQSVSYSFYAKNIGSYNAYLNYITFADAAGATSNKVCIAGEGTDQTLVNQACTGISISVKVGNDEAVTTSQEVITNHMLAKNTNEQVVVTINYAENSALADGAFDVNFGDIFLTYSSVSDGVGIPEIARTYDVWDGESVTALASLTVDESTKTVEINSAADLAGFRDAVNAGNLYGYTTNLNVNIDLNDKNWTPIGIKTTDSYATNYVGTFNGNGNVIKGINVNQETDLAGFFGRVSGVDNVTIKDLIIEGKSVSGGKTAGGLIAYVDYNETVKPEVVIDKVTTNMYVESADSAGGFMGRSYSYGNTYITNSTNNGEIKANNPETARGKLSGFVGTHADGPLVIKNCVNNGNASGGTYATGFVSYLDSEGIVTIEDSINNGNMTSLSSSDDMARNTIAAGFVGQVANYYAQYSAGTIKNCVNNGTIEASAKAGGIGGFIINMNIIDSTNNGNVTVTETTDKNHNGAGGIIGLAKQSFTVENSTNNGNVTGTVAVGGIVGMANMYSLDFNQPYNARFEIKNSIPGTTTLSSTSSGLVGRVVGEVVLPEQYKGTAQEVVQTIIGTDKNPGDTLEVIGGSRYTW